MKCSYVHLIRRTLWLGAALVLSGWLSGVQRVHADTIPWGIGTSCSLANAIQSANTDSAVGFCNSGSGADTLTTVGGVYDFPTKGNSTGGQGNNGLPAITSEISIVGNGAWIRRDVASCPAIPANSDKDFRLFYVSSQGDLTLSNVSLIGGCVSEDEYGGAIHNDGGTVTLANTVIRDSQAERGGGISNIKGAIRLSDTQVFSNTVFELGGGSFGGGIYNEDGEATLSTSDVYANNADFGGGIYNTGADSILELVADTLVQHNRADFTGGGILNANSQATLSTALVISNTTGGSGGGIYNVGPTARLTLTEGSLIQHNRAGLDGGGILNDGGQATLSGARVISNSAASQGGGLQNEAGLSTLTQVTLIGNQAGNYGAAYQRDGTVKINQSCIQGNADTAVGGGSSNAPFDATLNWWGATDGPSGFGPGSGDSAAMFVDYSGFSTAPIASCPTVGGTVIGLAGNGLVLQLNDAEELAVTANGDFRFSTMILDVSDYSVVVKTQPTGLSQSCTVSNGQGIFTGGRVTNVTVTCTTNLFSVAGSHVGLVGKGLVLQNNNGDDLTLSGNQVLSATPGDSRASAIPDSGQPRVSGPLKVDGCSAPACIRFAFATKLVDGSQYSVSVKTQPTGPSQTCAVTSGASGIIDGQNVTNVLVECTTDEFTIGGNVSGLLGSGLILQNNSGDDLAVNDNGTFTFASSLADGMSYEVTVKTQPDDSTQPCTVGNGTGTVSGGKVTNISVVCAGSTMIEVLLPIIVRQ